MNKQEYLTALEKALKSKGVRDLEDIVEEYSEHFDMKIADGFSEEEIAAKLAPPSELAGQYKEIGTEKSEKSGGLVSKILKACGVVTLDLAVAPTLLAFYIWVFALGLIAFVNAVAGIILVTGIGQSELIQASRYIHIPPMPYISSLLTGIALLGLAVLSAMGTEYCRLYVNQSFKKYARWHKNVLTSGPKLPPIPLNPLVTPKKRRVMRTMVFISLLVFGIGLVAGMISMMLIAGAFEPWHTWGWFV